MNEGLKKFEELLKTDAAFQGKMKAAMENYTGERTEQAVFEAVLVPLAQEYGIAASFEEYKEYINHISSEDRELSEDEIDQVAGGKVSAGGLVAMFCNTFGFGIGAGGGSDGGGACAGVGFGGGGTTVCVTLGATDAG